MSVSTIEILSSYFTQKHEKIINYSRVSTIEILSSYFTYDKDYITLDWGKFQRSKSKAATSPEIKEEIALGFGFNDRNLKQLLHQK